MRDTLHFRLGQEQRALRDIDPTMTVLEYLRGPERLCGTKEGCAEGDCGACTVVLVDAQGHHQAVNACVLFVPALDGKQLLTVEHLANADGTLHPVQQAMRDNHALQCGFCTPGVVCTMAAITADDAKPSEDQMIAAMSGHICRCTGYQGIRRAIRQITGSAQPTAEHAAGEHA
jgi:xanthine dehydrogenase small subunit